VRIGMVNTFCPWILKFDWDYQSFPSSALSKEER
jgi:hypothetical protein